MLCALIQEVCFVAISKVVTREGTTLRLLPPQSDCGARISQTPCFYHLALTVVS